MGTTVNRGDFVTPHEQAVIYCMAAILGVLLGWTFATILGWLG